MKEKEKNRRTILGASQPQRAILHPVGHTAAALRLAGAAARPFVRVEAREEGEEQGEPWPLARHPTGDTPSPPNDRPPGRPTRNPAICSPEN